MARKQKNATADGNEYICPYCFARVDLGSVHYVCSGQTCARTFASTAASTRNGPSMKYVSSDGQNEIDYEKSLFYGKDPAGRDAVIAKNHIIRDSSGVCDVCRRPVYTRVCPVCHNLIPPGAEEEGNRIFVILGPKSVGKSHYIAVLINQLKNQVSAEFNGVLNAATDGTTLKYRDMYYRRLFEEKRKLLPTKSFEESNESREPLIYYLRIFDSDRPKVFTFAFFDTAGEDLVSSDRMMSLSINSFISKAAGIVYLVDPLQVRYINQRIHVDNKPPVGPDVSDVLNNICQIIRTNNKLSPKARIDIPIAVVLTKSDVLFKSSEDEEEDKVLFGQCSSLHIPREHGRYDQENFEQIDAELSEYLRRCVGENFIQTVGGFREHCFFAVSALGCNPTGSSLPRGVSPMRVEDPFIWLLNREGLQ
ncbi:MAG: hypothetical protein Q4Q58_03955 [Thermoplasmata archaeon]|nr:hypothetical protein [Thermoplasmata archaeon]